MNVHFIGVRVHEEQDKLDLIYEKEWTKQWNKVT